MHGLILHNGGHGEWSEFGANGEREQVVSSFAPREFEQLDGDP